jgi:CubicO group peptidase (beta-lactamase class C family)
MKPNKLILIIPVFVFFTLFSCEKNELNEPVSSDCSLPFADSSVNNPKNSAYQALLDKYVKKGLPGLIVLIRTPAEGLWIGASGYARIEDRTPMKKCKIVYSASIGKTYCAVAIMKLIEEGKLSLDDKINLYLPADVCDKIPNGNIATIRNLLGHRAGIPNCDYQPQFIADVLNDPFSIATDDLIKYVYCKKPLFVPGEGYEYSSTGYEIMASVYDYYLFIEALVKGDLVSPQSFRQMTEWRDTYSWSTNKYGFGLFRKESSYGYKIGHSGSAMGAASDMYYFPEHDITIVSACNLGTFIETELSLKYENFRDELPDVVFN